MPILAHPARHPTTIVWIMALLATAIALLALGLPSPHPTGAAWSCAHRYTDRCRRLVCRGAGGRRRAPPAPALLIAGLSAAGWPLLALAALAGTLVSLLGYALKAIASLRREAMKPRHVCRGAARVKRLCAGAHAAARGRDAPADRGRAGADLPAGRGGQADPIARRWGCLVCCCWVC